MVVGKRNVGKSSLIDALRSLSADDKESAKLKTSVSNTVYPFFIEENHLCILFIEAEQNLPLLSEKEETDSTALCLLVINGDLDLQWLSNQCKCRQTEIVIIMSKMNTPVENAAKEHKQTHSKEMFITSVRNSIAERLKTTSLGHFRVFLIDSYNPDQYDFKQLEMYLSQNSDTQEEIRIC